MGRTHAAVLPGVPVVVRQGDRGPAPPRLALCAGDGGAELAAAALVSIGLELFRVRLRDVAGVGAAAALCHLCLAAVGDESGVCGGGGVDWVSVLAVVVGCLLYTSRCV